MRIVIAFVIGLLVSSAVNAEDKKPPVKTKQGAKQEVKPEAKKPEAKKPATVSMMIAGVTTPIPPENEGPISVTVAMVCGDKINLMLKQNEIMRDALKELPLDRRPCHAAALLQLCIAIEADRTSNPAMKAAMSKAWNGSVLKHRASMCGPTITEEESAYLMLLPAFLPAGVPLE